MPRAELHMPTRTRMSRVYSHIFSHVYSHVHAPCLYTQDPKCFGLCNSTADALTTLSVVTIAFAASGCTTPPD